MITLFDKYLQYKYYDSWLTKTRLFTKKKKIFRIKKRLNIWGLSQMEEHLLNKLTDAGPTFNTSKQTDFKNNLPQILEASLNWHNLCKKKKKKFLYNNADSL